MIKKVEGIVISAVDYKESSKIINILTKEEGIIGALARGCKNPKSKVSATSNILCYGNFHLNYQNKNLPTIIEIDLLDSFKQIRKDLIKLNFSVFLLDLSGQVYKHEQNKNIYQLLIEGLIKINEGLDAQIITNIIELKLLEYLGIKPIMDCCVNCQTTKDIVTISSYKGGYLCKNCVGTEYIYHLKTLKLMKLFYYIHLPSITKIEVSQTIKKEISQFITDYYDRYAGLYLKSKIF